MRPEPTGCVICGSSEESEQGGLCPAHTYDLPEPEQEYGITPRPGSLPWDHPDADPLADMAHVAAQARRNYRLEENL